MRGSLRNYWLRTVLAVLFAAGASAGFADPDSERDVRTILQMADYVAVEYPRFVHEGEVSNAAEYREQQEFAARIGRQIGELPEREGREKLLGIAGQLAAVVQEKASGDRVVNLVADLRAALLDVYPVAMAPRQPPEPSSAAALYQQQCAGCHGAEGRGDGPLSAGMTPPPVNFHDRERAAQRTVFALFNAITLGIDGTAMPSFGQLSETQRWALAFRVATMPYSDSEVSQGKALWRDNADVRRAVPDLETLAETSPAQLRPVLGERAAPVMAYLRSDPSAVVSVQGSGHLDVARSRLEESLDAYRGGAQSRARDLALSAYLDGFELVEPALQTADASLKQRIEVEMQTYRSLIEKGAAVDRVAEQAALVGGLLDRAAGRLGGGALSATASFLGSLVILGREGLEAILVLAAIFAFVRRSGRSEALPYVHAGWMAALALGALTWFVAATVIDISGGNRELTEGVTALAAAAVLLYVGFWLHNKSHADSWQQFMQDKLGGAVDRRNLWALCGLAFLAVYREIFEIVLFYQSLWLQGNHGAILAGLIAAAVLLAALSWAIYRFSMKLPLARFFSWSSLFIAALAVVFAGNGIAALQEAGVMPTNSVPFVRVPLLGIYPNVEVLAAQMTILACVIGGFWFGSRAMNRSRSGA